jgi:hypothetical protein
MIFEEEKDQYPIMQVQSPSSTVDSEVEIALIQKQTDMATEYAKPILEQ